MRISQAENKSSQLAFKNFKLPILQVSKPQFCNKVLHDFRKSLEQNKQTLRNQHEPKVRQIMKKLKMVSLIKSDKGSLSTIPIYENYCPYRRISRVVQTDFRKINNADQRKPVKSHNRQSNKFRNKTEVKEDLMVSKMNMNINLSQLKSMKLGQVSNFPSHRMKKSHKRSSTQAIHNFNPISERKPAKTKKKVEKLSNAQEEPEPNLFLTEGDQILFDEEETQVENLDKKKGKSTHKHKFYLKADNKNSLENQILNNSLRGWTKYNKLGMDDFPQQVANYKKQGFL